MPRLLVEQGKIIEIFRENGFVFSVIWLWISSVKRMICLTKQRWVIVRKKIVKYLNKTILRWAQYTFLTNHRRVIKTPPLNNTMSLEILEQLAQNLCTNQNQPFQVPLYIQHSLFTRATQLFYTMLSVALISYSANWSGDTSSKHRPTKRNNCQNDKTDRAHLIF